MNELPVFFQLIKQNIFLYSLLTNGTLDTAHLAGSNFYQYTPNSVQVTNFVLSEKEVFSSMTAGIRDEVIDINFRLKNDRFLEKTKEYFGKDSFLRIRNRDPEMKNPYSEVRSKILYLKAFDIPLEILIRTSPHFGDVLTISTDNNPLLPDTYYRNVDDQTLRKYFEASAMGELLMHEQNDKRGQNQMWRNTMERLEEIHARDNLTLLEPLLVHEHPNVRRWTASILLLAKEESAKAVLEDLSILDSFVGEEARRILKDWNKGKSQFDFLEMTEE